MFHEYVFPFSLSPKGTSFHVVSKSMSKSAQCANVFIDDVVPSITPVYDNQGNICVTTSNFGLTTITPPCCQNDVTPNTQPTHPQRRSHKVPTYLQDYVCPKPNAATCSTPLSLSSLFCRHSHIAPDFLALTSQELVNNVCNDSESSSFEEAILNPAWKTAMPQEYEALHTLGLFLVMVKKSNRTAIGTKLIKKSDIWFDLIRFGFKF
uniref:Integrase core domain containing protein n=1 Tax=Solanum tuberosum TaxID=4113 RepID=M1DAG2_SOLTU